MNSEKGETFQIYAWPLQASTGIVHGVFRPIIRLEKAEGYRRQTSDRAGRGTSHAMKHTNSFSASTNETSEEDESL